MEKQSIHLSKMPKTWILDLDGTIVRHDGPFLDGEDSFLPGAKEFLEQISSEDMIIFLTARTDYEKAHPLRFLKEQKVRYDYIIFGAGRGERILINDKKRDGLLTAHAINTDRDTFCQLDFIMDVDH